MIESTTSLPYKYLVFTNGNWKPTNNKCAFYTNGTVPKCGAKDAYVLTSSDALTPPSFSFSKAWCAKAKISISSNWNGKCQRTFDVKYTTDYKYFSNGAKQANQTIKCR